MKAISFQDNKPGKECVIFGVFASGREGARLTFFELYSLQAVGEDVYE